MEKVNFTIKVFDNFLEIIPNDGVKDNSIYEIKFKHLIEENGTKELNNQSVKICTQMTPCYSSINAIRALLGDIDIDDETILYHIREASNFADYIKNSMEAYNVINVKGKDLIDYQVSQLTKYKAAYECALRTYMDKASGNSIKGTLGDITFDSNIKMPDIKDLLNSFLIEIDKWKLAIQGHNTDLRPKIKSGVKSSNSQSYNNSVEASKTPEYSRRDYT